MGRHIRLTYVHPNTKKKKLLCRDVTDRSFGEDLKDPFFDGGADELLTAMAIIDLIGIHDNNSITVRFDKRFLKNVMRSHIQHIRTVYGNGHDAHRH